MQVHRLSDIGIIVYVYNIHTTWLFFLRLCKIEHVLLQQLLWSQKNKLCRSQTLSKCMQFEKNKNKRERLLGVVVAAFALPH